MYVPVSLPTGPTHPLLSYQGHSGSQATHGTSTLATYQVTQGAGQLLGHLELPWGGEDVTLPVHEKVQRTSLHKLFHHDVCSTETALWGLSA